MDIELLEKLIGVNDTILLTTSNKSTFDKSTGMVTLATFIKYDNPEKNVHCFGKVHDRLESLIIVEDVNKIDLTKTLLIVLGSGDSKDLQNQELLKANNKVVIDFKEQKNGYADLNIVEIHAVSVCEIVAEMNYSSTLGSMTEDLAITLYTGIQDATRYFSVPTFNSHKMAGYLASFIE